MEVLPNLKYDFDAVCDRKHTDCAKWDLVKPMFGHEDVLPMWVADMDFPVAPPILEALRKRVEHRFFGYTQPGHTLIEAVVERLERRMRWKIKPEWIVFTPGVIPALHTALRAFTHPGDEVILQTPVYYPFFPTVTLSGCQVLSNELKLENGRYSMDYSDLERKFLPRVGMRPTSSRAKAIILCNPHNPIGRVWGRDELKTMGEIVLRHHAVVISDEIHCELLYKGNQHAPFASVGEEFEQNCVVCMAPSKTFNLAGLHASSIVIPNKRLREAFVNAATGIVPSPNVFGLTAMEAAYRYGDEWVDELLEYLQGNLATLVDYFESHIPRIKVIRPQGTYLVWLDCRALGLDDMALRAFMRDKAKVGLDDGFLFGLGGSGFERMNIACPRSLLQEALRRIENAVNAL